CPQIRTPPSLTPPDERWVSDKIPQCFFVPSAVFCKRGTKLPFAKNPVVRCDRYANLFALVSFSRLAQDSGYLCQRLLDAGFSKTPSWLPLPRRPYRGHRGSSLRNNAPPVP